MNVFKILFFVCCSLHAQVLPAQNYQAIHGSSYAGSLGVANNPAAIVFVPYKWDVTLLAAQLKHSTNALTIQNYSLLSAPTSAVVMGQNGVKKRFVTANQNLRLLNARINTNASNAVAFGINLRSHISASSSESNWQDSMFTLADFLSVNTTRLPISARAAGTVWAEYYVSYARTIKEDGFTMMNAGITLKLNRSITGAYATANDIIYQPVPGVTRAFELKTGSLEYGLSASLDRLVSLNSTRTNRKVLLKKPAYSIGADVGFEYLKLTDEDSYEGGLFAYETKIGISILDVGYNKYMHSKNSRIAVAGLPGITDTIIEHNFSTIESLQEFNDQLETVAETARPASGEFIINHPARLVINIDQHLLHNFFINAELSQPLGSILSPQKLYIKDLNFLAVTPRWELKTVGAFLPLQYNSRNGFWLGAAIKAGPLLMGTHNLANVFAKNRMQAGGLYLALTVRPGKLYNRNEDFPAEKRNGRALQNLRCPTF